MTERTLVDLKDYRMFVNKAGNSIKHRIAYTDAENDAIWVRPFAAFHCD